MKIAKFIIMLQVLFLISVFVFSANAVYQPGHIGPLAITNLAVRQQGYELASPKEHEMYQALLSNMVGMAKAAGALKTGQIPDNAQVLDIPGVVSPVYLVSFLDETDKRQFLVVMARGDESGKIATVIEKNDELSDQFGIFVGLSPTQSIESIIAGKAKASSGGTFHLDRLFEMELIKNADRLKRLQDELVIARNRKSNVALPNTFHEDASSGVDTETKRLERGISAAKSRLVNIRNAMLKFDDLTSKTSSGGTIENLPLLIKQLESENFYVLRDAIRTISESKAGPAAYPALGALMKLLDHKDPIIRVDTPAAISAIGPIALPSLNKRLKTIDSNSKQAEVIRGIIEDIAAISKASSAGMTEDLFILIEQLEKAEDPTVRLDSAFAIAAKGPDAYLAFDRLFEIWKSSRISKDQDVSADSAFAISGIGPSVLPLLNERLNTVDSEQAEGIRDIIEDIAAISKASAAGTNQLDRLALQLRDTKLELQMLQSELVTASHAEIAISSAIMDADEVGTKDTTQDAAMQSDFNEAKAKVMGLKKAVDMAQLKIEDMQNIMAKRKFAALISKASSAGMDQLTIELKAAELELETLQGKLATAKIDEDYAFDTLIADALESGEIDAGEMRSDDHDKAMAKVTDIEREVYIVKFKIEDIRNAMAKLTVLASKASSAGYQRDIAGVIAYLSGATALFTDVDTIPELDTDMLSKQIEMYKDAIDKFESIKNQSPDAAIAVAEHLKLTQASFNTMTATRNIAAEDAALMNVTGTIVINDNDIPNNQRILLTMLDKANPYLEALETRLGCKVRLLSQYNLKLDGATDMIAISSMSVDGIPRRIDINSITQDGYLPLELVIVLAKGLLTYNQDTRPALDGTIAQMYRFITKAPITQKLLEAFLRNSVFVLDLPIPLAIDEAYYEQLHRQALAALIAA
jgi:hypothetical protein